MGATEFAHMSRKKPVQREQDKDGPYKNRVSPWRRSLPDSEEGTRVLVAKR